MKVSKLILCEAAALLTAVKRFRVLWSIVPSVGRMTLGMIGDNDPQNAKQFQNGVWQMFGENPLS